MLLSLSNTTPLERVSYSCWSKRTDGVGSLQSHAFAPIGD